MLCFQSSNVTSKFDLLRVKVQAIDFIKSLKFDKGVLEKLANLVYELTKELVLEQPDACIYINIYRLERKKGLEINVLTTQMTVEKVLAVLKNNSALAKKGIYPDKSAGFLDTFDLNPEKSGSMLHIIKLLR